jgi:hypothetical protein
MKSWGHSLNKNNHREVAKQKHPTCLRQQWFVYASLLSTARCPSLDQTSGGNDEAGVVEGTLADVPAREHR